MSDRVVVGVNGSYSALTERSTAFSYVLESRFYLGHIYEENQDAKNAHDMFSDPFASFGHHGGVLLAIGHK